MVDPAAGELMERIVTLATAQPAVLNAIKPSSVTAGADADAHSSALAEEITRGAVLA